jgi:hypothetical protein
MLPDFPKIKSKLQDYWNQYGEYRLRIHSQTMNIGSSHRNYEGNQWTVQREDGTETTSSYKKAESAIKIHFDDVPNLTPDKIAAKIDQLTHDMASQVDEQLFQTLMSVGEQTDRVVDGSNRSFIDNMLHSLESMLISFDKDGAPRMPTAFVSPQMAEQLKDKIPEWNNDPDIDQKYNEIMMRKREEWRDRESSRRLVE